MTLLMTMMIMMDCSITVSLPYPSFKSIFLLIVDNDDDGLDNDGERMELHHEGRAGEQEVLYCGGISEPARWALHKQ